ncbi:putative uncharacterized protein C8orf89 homolog isoform X3 [Festucalex cinctus]
MCPTKGVSNPLASPRCFQAAMRGGPSTLVLRGLSAFPVQNCKYSRAKGNDPACNLLTLKGDLKSQSYPDPVMGASRSFLHRISELSCLEGETVRQEKLKKWRMSRKAASS